MNGKPITMTQAQIEQLVQENEALKAKLAQTGKVTCKVSDKGALSVYGLGRFPVTLYSSQWRRLLDNVPMIQKFMSDHAGEFTEKD